MKKLFNWVAKRLPSKRVKELRAPVKPKPAVSGLITLYHRNNTLTQYHVWFDDPADATNISEHELWQRVERWFGSSNQQPLVIVSLATSSTSMFDRCDIVRVELTDTSIKESK